MTKEISACKRGGGGTYTKESGFMRVLLKKHNITTYDKDWSWAVLSEVEKDLGIGLTG